MGSKRLIESIYEFLKIKSGKEISKSDLLERFLDSERSHKKKKHKDSEKLKQKEDDIYFLLSILESEKMISIEKKNITIAKPFHLKGKISISKKGDGFVQLSSGSEIFIPVERTETAISGDLVEVLPTSIGKKFRLEGEVIEIIKRGRELYRMKVTSLEGKYIVGTLLDMLGDHKDGVVSKKSILKDTLDQIKLGDVLIVKLRSEHSHDNFLYDVSLIRLESDSHFDKDFERILMKYNYTQVYPDSIPLHFKEDVNENTIDDWGNRVDLRDLYTITVDGATAKDFDDAISLIEEENSVRYYVHIADVSYYVKHGSALDEEAYKRATSVYLANKVVPMLPPELSEDLCSLVAGKNRLAFTVEISGSYNGEFHYAKCYKSIIKVNQRYTYDMAEEEIQKNEPGNWVCKVMKLAEGLKAARMKSGRVDLNVKESQVIMDENNNVVEIVARERLRSHIMIEELMLSANIAVAEKLRKNKIPSLFRIHQPMESEKLETLNSFLKMYGFKHQLKNSDYPEIKSALEFVKGHPAEKLFNYFLLRSFMQAYYSGENLGHWGLGFEHYCHFTSPIRRYPDLVCHRALDALLQKDSNPYTADQITVMGFHCSEEERKAADAERDIIKLKACRYVSSKNITEFKGAITGIKPNYIFVELENLNVEGVIKHIHFTDMEELVLPNEFSFVSKKHSKLFYLGEKIEVELEGVDFEEIRIYVKPKKTL